MSFAECSRRMADPLVEKHPWAAVVLVCAIASTAWALDADAHADAVSED